MILNSKYKLFTLISFSILLSSSACRAVAISATPPAIQPSHISTGLPSPSAFSSTPALNPEPFFTPAASPSENAVTSIPPAGSSIDRPSPAITSTIDFSKFVDAWSAYTNDKYGFSFDYPAIYDVPTYSSCSVQVRTSEPWIVYLTFGHRSELAIGENDLPTLSDYVDRWVESKQLREDWSLTKRYDQLVNGIQAVALEYTFSIRWGTTTFLGVNNLIYIFNWTAGSGCDIPEIKLNELYAYNHAIETFRSIPLLP